MMYLSIVITLLLLYISSRPWTRTKRSTQGRRRYSNGTYAPEIKPRLYHTVIIKEGAKVVGSFRLEDK